MNQYIIKAKEMKAKANEKEMKAKAKEKEMKAKAKAKEKEMKAKAKQKEMKAKAKVIKRKKVGGDTDTDTPESTGLISQDGTYNKSQIIIDNIKIKGNYYEYDKATKNFRISVFTKTESDTIFKGFVAEPINIDLFNKGFYIEITENKVLLGAYYINKYAQDYAIGIGDVHTPVGPPYEKIETMVYANTMFNTTQFFNNLNTMLDRDREILGNMKYKITINLIPKSEQFIERLKYLLLNIDPSLAQKKTDLGVTSLNIEQS